jgi:hypothetical protein
VKDAARVERACRELERRDPSMAEALRREVAKQGLEPPPSAAASEDLENRVDD